MNSFNFSLNFINIWIIISNIVVLYCIMIILVAIYNTKLTMIKWSPQSSWLNLHSIIHSLNISKMVNNISDVLIFFTSLQAERVLSFVPPDGQFLLISYTVGSTGTRFVHTYMYLYMYLYHWIINKLNITLSLTLFLRGNLNLVVCYFDNTM